MQRRCTLGHQAIALGAIAWICAPVLANGAERDPEKAGLLIGVGWRGDGAGRYPQADPPLRWGRVAKSVAQLRALPSTLAGSVKAEVARLDIDTTRYPRFHKGWFLASPLYHEGLLYCVSEGGVLSVIDVAKRQGVYQKVLDADLYMAHVGDPSRGGFGASPALAGRYIYLFGNRGTCLVIEPGREYLQVAKNRLERIAGKTSEAWGGAGSGYPESTMSSPTFEGKRLYYRALQTLYCIEERR